MYPFSKKIKNLFFSKVAKVRFLCANTIDFLDYKI